MAPDSEDEELSALDELDEELSPPGAVVAFGSSDVELLVDDGAGGVSAFGGGVSSGAVSFPFVAGGGAKAGGGAIVVSFPAAAFGDVPFNAAGGGRATEPGAVPFTVAAVEFVITVVLLIIVAVPLATLGKVVALVPCDRVTVEVTVFAGDETVCVTFWPDTSCVMVVVVPGWVSSIIITSTEEEELDEDEEDEEEDDEDDDEPGFSFAGGGAAAWGGGGAGLAAAGAAGPTFVPELDEDEELEELDDEEELPLLSPGGGGFAGGAGLG